MSSILETTRMPMRIGGNPSLDFVNTREYFNCDACPDVLTSYVKLLAWCRQTGLLTEAEGERLLKSAEQQPDAADIALEAAHALRVTFFSLFDAVITNTPLAQNDLTALNKTLNQRQRLVQSTPAGVEWAWEESPDLQQVLTPIAFEAAQLLTSDQREHVRQCPNCGWMFVDTSRNHSRRWCSMEMCGSQVKSRRQYQRRKQTAAP